MILIFCVTNVMGLNIFILFYRLALLVENQLINAKLAKV